MSGAWTPGPWVVERNKRTWGWVDVVGPSLGVGGPTQATDLTLADEVKRIAEAHLIAAAPDMYDAGQAQTAIIRRAQDILTQYLIPDGIDGPEAINQLLGLLDGPDQRAAQSSWDAALAKARGEAK